MDGLEGCRLRRLRFLTVPAFIALLVLGAPASVAADHCGETGSITPASGPPGTTFVFRTNLGSPSILRIYRDERLVREVSLAGDADVRYRIRTGPGDGGMWRARAEVRGRPDCYTELSFVVVDPPETSTSALGAAPTSRRSIAALAAVAGLLAFIVVLAQPGRRLRA